MKVNPTLFIGIVMTCTLNQTNGGVSFRVAAAFARIASTEQVIAGPKVSSFYPVKYQRHSDSLCKIYATNVPSSDNQNRLLARQYIQDGMELFRKGDVSKSIEYFNAAEQNDRSITPYLWQRGLSYYYNQQYDKASQQFRMDVSVNPYDVEEIVWDIASQLRYNQIQNQNSKVIFPIPNQLSLPPGSRDRRRIMGYVYKLFRGEGTEQDLARAGSSKEASLSDEFYALFYLAVYNEALNRPGVATLYLRQALGTKYGQQSNDYMVACARIQSKDF